MGSLKDKVVVVTGGSAGLGKAVAAAFAAKGAVVISLSRSAVEDTGNIRHIQADVTCDRSVQAAVESILESHQKIDVWVNNVGQSIRTGFRDATLEDYRQLMEMNFYTAVRCSLTALSHVEETSGSIVNIGSLAARTGWKHIAPYVTSKHALSGFAHQLRIEGPENVHCLFVCPGPVRRQDAATRYQEQAAGLEDSAAAPGAGVKLSGIDPQKLAERIVVAVEQRRPELVVPVKARMLFAILQISPRLGDWLLRAFS